jgi:hypothetical protein
MSEITGLAYRLEKVLLEGQGVLLDWWFVCDLRLALMGYNLFALLPHLSCIVEVPQQLLALPIQDLQEAEVISVFLLKSSSLLEI